MTGIASPRVPPRLGRPPLPGRLSGTGAVATLSIVLAAVVMSSSYTLTKIALMDVPPLTIGLIRFAIAAVVMHFWVRVIRNYPRPEQKDRSRLAVGGLLGITLYFTIENIGVDLATPTDAALLVAAYPAITALLELLIYRQRTSWSGAAGIVLAVLGVYLVVGYSADSSPGRLAGDILLVVSGVVWALYNFATRGLGDRYATPVVLYYQARAGALAFLPLALLEHDAWHTPTHVGATVGSLAALAIVCSIAGLGLYAKGLQHLRASTAVNLLNLVPVFGLAIPIAVLGESVTAAQIAGGLVVIAGVTLSARQKAQPAPTGGVRSDWHE